ncbi:serine/threonine-protein phosphatase 4 regulatory subunit 1-like isoform X6 [Nylanderia fulva]|nr:serine/threonine-protein phosphatase 4 regulatory subunit 1-like isoform X6 [Nylanderia fulva]
MEAEDDEEVSDSNERSDESSEVWDCVGGGGDEGGGDEQLFQISRLQQHATSITSFNRQMVGRILVEMFRTSVNNNVPLIVDEVMHHVQLVVDDNDALVRSDLVEQIPNVAIICLEAPHFYEHVLRDHLLCIIIQYLNDSDNQVRQMAQSALITILKRNLLSNDTIEQNVCLTVELLSYMSPDEHLRNANISFMCRVAPLIDSELTEKIFLKRYLDLCEDNDMMVRRTCATHFAEMCVAVGKDHVKAKLIPTFMELCGDRVWGVRKACVEVILPVACCTSPEERQKALADMLAKHLNDDSKWVRTSAFQILGPFISLFAKQFADVCYNKNGELVYTSKLNNHLSLCYSYEAIFPTKGAIKNQISDMDDNTKSSFYLPMVNVRHDNVKTSDSLEGYDCQKIDNCYLDRQLQMKYKERSLRKKRGTFPLLKKDVDDTEKYNPFLYYYIPPGIPLDDELTHAARQSAMNRNNANKTVMIIDNETFEKQSLDKFNAENNCSEIPIPVVNLSDEDDSNTDVDKLDNQKEEKDDDDDGDCPPSSQDTTDSDGTQDFEIYLLNSMDKSDKSCNLDAKDNGQDIVPQKLINYYVSMADPEQCVDVGTDITHHCAFSFPAVALTLGAENWHYLRKAYQSLSSAKHWKVRHSLASSIHEIAMILGEELTATDLVPIYDGFIKDLDEVRIGVLKHLATFLKILKPDIRCQYLPRLNDFLATDNESNWRFKQELGTQLLEIIEMSLFSPNEVAQSIAPLSLQLLVDKVFAVKEVAVELITRIVIYLSTEDALVMSLIHELRDTLVVNAKRWMHRQTYALVCSHLIRNNAIAGSKFSKEMLPCLMKLSTDRVPNVRLAVARTIATDVIGMGLDTLGMETMEKVETVLLKLSVDVDRDVRILAGGKEQLPDALAYCSSDENNRREQKVEQAFDVAYFKKFIK